MHSSHPIERFSTRADFYVRSRPRYPKDLIAFLHSTMGLLPTHVIADVGSGTGFLAEPFLANGNPVFCVEPNAPMRQAAERALAAFDNFHSINGTAEATSLRESSVDFITAGQAFHWFEPNAARLEFQRILRPPSAGVGGIVILIWNDRRLDDPLAIDYQRLIDRYSIDHEAVKARDSAAHEPSVLRSFFGAGGYQHKSLDNFQNLDEQGFLNRILSASYMPARDHPAYAAMAREAQNVFAARQKDGQVRLRYDTNIYYGRLTQAYT